MLEVLKNRRLNRRTLVSQVTVNREKVNHCLAKFLAILKNFFRITCELLSYEYSET